jgi:GNAT superfamily N-acetyltransferase
VLWRVRTTMSDRPGSLATLARHCGERDVNILALQIFPGVVGVTDELVLHSPDAWGAEEVAELVAVAGGTAVTVDPCTEHALVDGPIHYLHALRRVAHDPTVLAEMLARLLDAEAAEPAPGGPTGPVDTRGTRGAVDASDTSDTRDTRDTMDVVVGPHRLLLRRTAPFTATEHARAIAFADVAAELLGDQAGAAGYGPTPLTSPDPVVRLGSFEDAPALMRMHQRCSADSVYRRYATPLARIDDRFARRLLVSGGGALVAGVGAEVVGIASLSGLEDGVVEVALLVEDGWQRGGLGTRLLASAARLARGHGAEEVVLRSPTHNPALMSLAFASGLRARVRREGDTVVVTVGVDGLKPLTMVPVASAAPSGGEPAPA